MNDYYSAFRQLVKTVEYNDPKNMYKNSYDMENLIYIDGEYNIVMNTAVKMYNSILAIQKRLGLRNPPFDRRSKLFKHINRLNHECENGGGRSYIDIALGLDHIDYNEDEDDFKYF